MAASDQAPSPSGEALSPYNQIYYPVSLNNFPNEIFFILFEFVAPADLLRCRQVCVRWKNLIDAILRDNGIWERFCKRDYKKIYKEAMWKSPNITDWYELYRSLYLWSQLHRARETIDEFCHSDTIDEEMRNAVVQERGMIMVHKRTRVVYHDLMTLEVVKRKGSAGQYVSLIELKDVVVMIGFNAQLHIVNKPNHDWHSDLIINTDEDDEIVFNDVKSFIIVDRTVIYITYRATLFSFHLDSDKVAHRIVLPEQLSEALPYGLAALGNIGSCLHILSMSQNMYTYVDKQVSVKFKLSAVTNVMDCLYKHNMLENMDWRLYYILLSQLKQKQHTGLLQFISQMRTYGDDLFFMGTQSAIVCLYYKPIKDGMLDLTQFTPIKKYNFSERIDIPILSVYPIINFEVTETKDGHRILVCMPRKILVITYVYEFNRPESKAVIPYVEMPDLSI